MTNASPSASSCCLSFNFLRIVLCTTRASLACCPAKQKGAADGGVVCIASHSKGQAEQGQRQHQEPHGVVLRQQQGVTKLNKHRWLVMAHHA